MVTVKFLGAGWSVCFFKMLFRYARLGVRGRYRFERVKSSLTFDQTMARMLLRIGRKILLQTSRSIDEFHRETTKNNVRAVNKSGRLHARVRETEGF